MTTDLRARAEALLATSDAIERRYDTWLAMVDAYNNGPASAHLCAQDAMRVVVRDLTGPRDAIIRDILAALPPDPTPTGERKVCAGWVAHPHYGCAHLLLATGPRGMLRASVGYTTGADAHSWRLTASDNGTEPSYLAVGCGLDSMEAAQLAAEDAAAELLRAGLRALGCK